MRTTNFGAGYEILDACGGEKLENWGGGIFIRPDPQIIWDTPREHPGWQNYHARYFRAKSGGGSWEFRQPQAEKERKIHYKSLTFITRPTGFKHMGLFPEQAVNWDLLDTVIRAANRPVKALNLFAYTGGATLACAAAGASVVHVDASAGMVDWARKNAAASGLKEAPIRWLVDDCEKFIQREIRRGNKYDIIIMDPPSYGRGPGGETFKFENKIYALLSQTAQIMSDNPLLLMLNSYTTGLSGAVMGYLLGLTFIPKFGGKVWADDIGIPVASTGLILPCGTTAVWTVNSEQLTVNS